MTRTAARRSYDSKIRVAQQGADSLSKRPGHESKIPRARVWSTRYEAWNPTDGDDLYMDRGWVSDPLPDESLTYAREIMEWMTGSDHAFTWDNMVANDTFIISQFGGVGSGSDAKIGILRAGCYACTYRIVIDTGCEPGAFFTVAIYDIHTDMWDGWYTRHRVDQYAEGGVTNTMVFTVQDDPEWLPHFIYGIGWTSNPPPVTTPAHDPYPSLTVSSGGGTNASQRSYIEVWRLGDTDTYDWVTWPFGEAANGEADMGKPPSEWPDIVI